MCVIDVRCKFCSVQNLTVELFVDKGCADKSNMCVCVRVSVPAGLLSPPPIAQALHATGQTVVLILRPALVLPTNIKPFVRGMVGGWLRGAPLGRWVQVGSRSPRIAMRVVGMRAGHPCMQVGGHVLSCFFFLGAGVPMEVWIGREARHFLRQNFKKKVSFGKDPVCLYVCGRAGFPREVRVIAGT